MAEISRNYLRQIAVLGQESFHKVQNLRVLITGLKGIGVECAKNLVLTGVGEVTLHDETLVTELDLLSNFFISPSDIGNKSRSMASLNGLQRLNPLVKVQCKEGNLDENLISKFSLVVVCDVNLQNLIHLNHYCRTKNPPIGFISCENWGALGYIFTDFGPDFIVYDKTGEENKSYYISNITKENPGIVSVHERHFLQDGDFVVFKEVQGMEEINNTPPRPVRVLTQNSFSIEDTTGYSVYQREGIVEHFKIPERVCFKSLESNYAKPNLIKVDNNCQNQLFIFTQAFIEFCKSTGNLPTNSDFEGISKRANEINFSNKESGGAYTENLDGNLLQDFLKKSQFQHPSVTSWLGAVTSSEALKFTGKYLPIMQWANFNWVEMFANEDSSQEKLKSSNVLLIGLGTLGSEVLKQCIQLGVKNFTLADCSKVKPSDRQVFYSSESVGIEKTSAIQSKLQENYSEINIRIENKGAENLKISDEDWEKIDFVISAVDNNKAREAIDKLVVWYEKTTIEGLVQWVLGQCNIYKPFVTPSYGESVVYIENKTPPSTIANFPHNIEQCIEFAKQKFIFFYEKTGNELLNFLEDPAGYISSADERENLEKFQSIYSYIELLQHNTFEECVKFAKEKFQELFNDSIARLVHSFPQDFKDEAGKPFWTGCKRFPLSIPFESSDTLHVDIVETIAILIATTLGIDYVKLNIKEIKELTQHRTHSLADLQTILSAHPPKQYFSQVKPQKFASDNSLHCNFIYGVSTIRARCYRISETDMFNTEIIAGNIIGCLPSSVSAVAAKMCMEIQKLQCGPIKNSMMNLGIFNNISWEPAEPKQKKSVEFDPDLCAPVKAFPEGFTVWDKIILKGPLSLTAVIEKFASEFSLKVNLLFVGKLCIYNGFAEGNDRMDKNIEELEEDLEGKKALYFEVSCEELQTGNQVVNPIIKYYLN